MKTRNIILISALVILMIMSIGPCIVEEKKDLLMITVFDENASQSITELFHSYTWVVIVPVSIIEIIMIISSNGIGNRIAGLIIHIAKLFAPVIVYTNDWLFGSVESDISKKYKLSVLGWIFIGWSVVIVALYIADIVNIRRRR